MYKDYGLSKKEWRDIKEDVLSNEMKSSDVKKKYDLDEKQTWFLYDRLLQEKYNHLYKREKLVDPQVGDFVYCDFDGFGKGKIVSISKEETYMDVKFEKRPYNTMFNTRTMITDFDGIKRKATRL